VVSFGWARLRTRKKSEKFTRSFLRRTPEYISPSTRAREPSAQSRQKSSTRTVSPSHKGPGSRLLASHSLTLPPVNQRREVETDNIHLQFGAIGVLDYATRTLGILNFAARLTLKLSFAEKLGEDAPLQTTRLRIFAPFRTIGIIVCGEVPVNSTLGLVLELDFARLI